MFVYNLLFMLFRFLAAVQGKEAVSCWKHEILTYLSGSFGISIV